LVSSLRLHRYGMLQFLAYSVRLFVRKTSLHYFLRYINIGHKTEYVRFLCIFVRILHLFMLFTDQLLLTCKQSNAMLTSRAMCENRFCFIVEIVYQIAMNIIGFSLQNFSNSKNMRNVLYLVVERFLQSSLLLINCFYCNCYVFCQATSRH